MNPHRRRVVVAACLAGTALIATSDLAAADPAARGGKFGDPYVVGDCDGPTLVHANDNSPVVHDAESTRVWVFKEITYSDGTSSSTVRLGSGISDDRLLTCVDVYTDDGIQITYVARLLESGRGDAR